MPGELQIPHWEWWIVIYFFTGGIAAGAYFTSAIIELVGGPEDRPTARMGYYIAFALLPICVIALIADLGTPLRFWHMIVYSHTFLPWPKWDSPISVGAYALLFFGLFAFLSFVDALVETGRLPWAPFREKYSGWPRKLYALIGAFFGFFIASYTGVLLAHTHLPVWADTPLLGALFAASAASTGMAAVALGLKMTKAQANESETKLKQADNIALILELILLIGLLIWLGSSAAPIFTGLSGILLIGGVILIGLIIPLIIQFRAGFQGIRSGGSLTMLAALLILIGGLLMRTVIVMGGQNLL